MAAGGTVRRLAAILAVDLVGYSRLMERDEGGTLARLKSARDQVIDPLLLAHHGRVVKLMGDGALYEFPSASDAVACALGIQQEMAKRESELPENERLRFRIGANLGDVIVDGEDIYGDGVNIAARLEALAEPGGICVSGKIREEVRRHAELAFVPMGRRQVKNIAEPIDVWRVDLGRRLPTPRQVSREMPRLGAFAAGLAVVLLAAGVALWWAPWQGEAQRIIEAWRADYNSARPHTSLGGLTPREFATRSGSDQTMNRTNLQAGA